MNKKSLLIIIGIVASMHSITTYTYTIIYINQSNNLAKFYTETTLLGCCYDACERDVAAGKTYVFDIGQEVGRHCAYKNYACVPLCIGACISKISVKTNLGTANEVTQTYDVSKGSISATKSIAAGATAGSNPFGAYGAGGSGEAALAGAVIGGLSAGAVKAYDTCRSFTATLTNEGRLVVTRTQ